MLAHTNVYRSIADVDGCTCTLIGFVKLYLFANRNIVRLSTKFCTHLYYPARLVATFYDATVTMTRYYHCYLNYFAHGSNFQFIGRT